MTDTPRTNKKEQVTIGDSILSHGVVNADFARQLERELAASQAELSMLEESENGLLKTIAVLEDELDTEIDKHFGTNSTLIRLLFLLADIRDAVGDSEGKLMQDDLVAHIKSEMADLAKYRDNCHLHCLQMDRYTDQEEAAYQKREMNSSRQREQVQEREREGQSDETTA